jgi:hypothetical protein
MKFAWEKFEMFTVLIQVYYRAITIIYIYIQRGWDEPGSPIDSQN